MTDVGLNPPAPVREILESLDEKQTVARTTAAAQQLRDLAAEVSGARQLPIAVVRNFTVEPIEPYLVVAGYRAGLDLRPVYSGYNPVPGGLHDVLTTKPAAVWIALRLEELSPTLTHDFGALSAAERMALADDALDFLIAMATDARQSSGALVFVDTFAPPARISAGIGDHQLAHGQLAVTRHLNQQLVQRLAELDGCYVLDVEQVFAEIGARDCYDARGDRTSHAPLTPVALDAVAGALVRHLLAASGPRAKCVVVDCDNTLWGGVIGEDGIGGITLSDTAAGRRFLDLQRELLDVKRRGVVLAIASKNEEADVLEVLRKHPECLLSETDFAAMRINWEPKATNIAAIAEELNLALEHIVFIDDDAVECDSVATLLPALNVVRWPHPSARFLDDLGYFDSLATTAEDAGRTEMYRAEAQRRGIQAGAASIDDYLASLEIVATVGVCGEEHLSRLAQLTQRTNQFNLTTRRYDVAQLAKLASSDDVVIRWVELTDRFGSYGTVGLGIVRIDADVAIIDTLLLSCRVIGRGAETALVNALARAVRERGAGVLVGEYLPSQRNGQVAELYGRLGFDGPTEHEDGSRWAWDLGSGDPPVAAWVTVTEAEASAQ